MNKSHPVIHIDIKFKRTENAKKKYKKNKINLQKYFPVNMFD